jgi:hypothetical protein
MEYAMFRVLMSSVIVFVFVGICSAVVQTEGGYVLVWGDEFDGAGRPDPNNWVYENGVRRRVFGFCGFVYFGPVAGFRCLC